MKNIQTVVRWGVFALAAALVVALTACGGGGGGGSSSSSSVGGADSAGSGAAGNLTMAQLQDLSSSAGTAATANLWLIIENASMVNYLSQMPAGSGNTATGSLFPVLTSTGAALKAVCQSGSYSASWKITSNAVATVGDFLSFTFNNCQRSSERVLNGAALYTVTALSSGGVTLTPVYSSSFAMKFTSDGASFTLGANALNFQYSPTVTAGSVTALTYTLTGGMTAQVDIGTATDGKAGTYAISNINTTQTVSSATSFGFNTNLSVNDGSLSYTVKNINPSLYDAASGTAKVLTQSVYQISGYQNVTLNVSSGLESSRVTGSNTDGSALSLTVPYMVFQ